jgi:hypothetical protein
MEQHDPPEKETVSLPPHESPKLVSAQTLTLIPGAGVGEIGGTAHKELNDPRTKTRALMQRMDRTMKCDRFSTKKDVGSFMFILKFLLPTLADSYLTAVKSFTCPSEKTNIE